jgi:hypothetical protein
MDATTMKTKDKGVLIGSAAWFVALWIMFPHAKLMAIVVLTAISGGLVWLALTFGKRKGKAALPAGFKADYRAAHIALDQTSGQLWIRPMRGRDRVLSRGQVLEWKAEYGTRRNVWGHEQSWDHTLILITNELAEPYVRVRMRNRMDVETWHARLSSWING